MDIPKKKKSRFLGLLNQSMGFCVFLGFLQKMDLWK
jgi:hypothetical protein